MSSITHQELVQNYQVIRVLGEGSFGKVFLVRHLLSKAQFAMKKYSKYYILKKGKQRSLIRSSQILQALEHPNIIRFLYYAIGEQDDEIFLIFEACKKGSLEEVKQKIFEMKQTMLIKQIMYQLAEGLAYLKSVCVAHRDLKPSNITFTSQGQLKIIDFDEAVCFKQMAQISMFDESFAKQLIEETASMSTFSRRSRVNSYVGTQLYMSPEMRDRQVTDERGDIWAYGCILYELVAGKSFMPEYEENGIEETLQNYQNELAEFSIPAQQKSSILDLLKQILKQSPEQRISVDQIMNHTFFYSLKVNFARNESKIKLRKFLRGNYNSSQMRNVLDALNLDLIGMKAGREKAMQLTQYPVLINIQQNMIEPKNILSRMKQWLYNLIHIPEYKVCFFLGGSHYFKYRSAVNESNKQYIPYNQIDSIKIVEDSIIIQGSNTQKWNYSQNKDGSIKPKHKWRYIVKSLLQDQVQLGILYDMLQYVLAD